MGPGSSHGLTERSQGLLLNPELILTTLGYGYADYQGISFLSTRTSTIGALMVLGAHFAIVKKGPPQTCIGNYQGPHIILHLQPQVLIALLTQTQTVP